MNNDRHDGKFLFGFFLGGLIGACIIFFLGTKEGKRMEKVLKKRGKDVLDELEEKLEELEENGKELIQKGERIKTDMLEKLEEKKEDLTEAAVERIDSALANIESLQTKGVHSTANLRKRFKNLPK